MFIATMETTSFSFVAVGEHGLLKHAQMYRLHPDWFVDCDIRISDIPIGGCMVDNDRILSVLTEGSETKPQDPISPEYLLPKIKR